MGNKNSDYKEKKERDENHIIMCGILYVINPYYKNYIEKLKFDNNYRFMSSIPRTNTIYITGNIKRHNISIYKYIEEERKIKNIHRIRIDYEKKEIYLNNVYLFMNPVCLMMLIELGKSATLELDFDEIKKEDAEIYINLIIKHLHNKINKLIINKYLILNDNLKENKTIKKIYFNNILRDYKAESLKVNDFNNIKHKKEIFIEFY